MMQQFEHRMTEVEDRTKSNQRRIEVIEKRQDDLDELISTVKVLAVREEAVEKDVKEIKGEVKSLAGKPAKRWDALMDKILWAFVAAVVGFLLARLGL